MANPRIPQMPGFDTPIDNGGQITMSQHWYQFLSRFFNKPDPEQIIAVGASPFTFQVVSLGAMRVFGTVTKIELSRNGTTYYDLGVTQGLLPFATNDIIRVTYPAAAPTLTFFPS